VSKKLKLGGLAVFALAAVACGGGTSHLPVTKTETAANTRQQTYSAEAFYRTTSFAMSTSTFHAFSATNGDVLIASDESGVFNAYRLDVNNLQRTALTSSVGSPIFVVSWFPKDDRFLYVQDGGGDELTHLFVQAPDGDLTDLTPGDNVKAGFLGWSSDGDSFYLYTNERDASAFDVYKYDSVDYSRELVYVNNQGLALGSISGDGRWIVLTRSESNADANLFLVNLLQPEQELIDVTPHNGDIRYAPLTFSADNQQLIFGTDEFGEFNQAWSYDLRTAKTSPLIKAEWDVMYVNYSRSGRYRVSGVNNDASTKVTIVDQMTGTTLDLSGLPQGDIAQVRFTHDETAIVFGINSDTSPYDLYYMALGSKPKRLTHALNPEIDVGTMINSEVVRFASYDGLKVPGLLYKPSAAGADTPVPALIWVHGGPGGQSRKGYRPAIQHLINHGYAVYCINNRGSSGYGKTFYHLDDKQHGEADLGDVVAAKSFLAKMPWIDGERIGIIGGSYGGYMVVAALAFQPEVFDVGINIFGVTNWVRTLKSIPPWWGSFRRSLYAELGDPTTDELRLKRISPLFHAGNIVRPLLVVQGANDPRVLQIESDELVESVRANNVPVEYVLFDDEGHGFRKRVNRIKASEAYLEFLQKHL